MSSLAALAIYAIVILSTLIAYYLHLKLGRSSRVLSVVTLLPVIIIPVVFATIHYSSSPDHTYYLLSSIDYSKLPLHEYLSLTGNNPAEIARWAISRIGEWVASSPYAFFSIYMLVTIVAYLAVLSRFRRILSLTPSQEMLVATFIFIIFFPYSLSVVSQMAAVPIFLIALSYLFERKYIAYIALSILTAAFHTSAIMAAPIALALFLIFNIKSVHLRRNTLLVFFSLITIILFSSNLMPSIISALPQLEGYDLYFQNDDGKYNNSMSHPAVYPLFGARLLLLASLWFTFMYRRKSNISRNQELLLMFALLGTIMFIPSPIALLAGRIGYFFDLFIILALVAYAKGFSQESLRAKVIVIAYCIAYFAVFYIVANWATLFPIGFIWDHPIN